MKDISEKYVKAVIHKNQIANSLLTGFVIGAALGVVCIFYFHFSSIGFFMSPLLMIIAFGIAFAGTPYMWKGLPKVYGFGPFSVILLLVKVVVASLGGFFITPIVLIFKSIQVHRYAAAAKHNKLLHSEKYCD